MNQKNYITPKGFERLKHEYSELIHNERPKLVEVIAWAASNGDRSENADYIYGKRRLREIDKRLHILQKKLENSEVIDPNTLTTDKVVFGLTVTVENEAGDLKKYQIVGEDEIDIKENKISWRSPLAKALLGKKRDDECILIKPSGQELLTIVDIEKS